MRTRHAIGRKRWLRMLALALLGLTGAAGDAGATPLYYDFEDGLGGWTLSGSIRREQVDVLGGEYAIFGSDGGIGPTQMSLEIDLTDIDALVLEQQWTTEPQPSTNLVTVLVYWTDSDGTLRFGRDRDGTSLLPPTDGFRERDTRSFDLSEFTGQATVIIQWNAYTCPVQGATGDDFFDPCFGSYFNGYIDDVRFTPVPEPATALLVGLGSVLLAVTTRRR